MSSDQFLTFIASKWNDMVDKAGVSASLKNCLSFMVWHIKRMPLDAAVVEFQRGRDSDAHTATSPGGEASNSINRGAFIHSHVCFGRLSG